MTRYGGKCMFCKKFGTKANPTISRHQGPNTSGWVETYHPEKCEVSK